MWLTRQPSLVLKAVKNEEYRHYLDEAVAMEKSLNLPTVDPSRCGFSTASLFSAAPSPGYSA